MFVARCIMTMLESVGIMKAIQSIRKFKIMSITWTGLSFGHVDACALTLTLTAYSKCL